MACLVRSCLRLTLAVGLLGVAWSGAGSATLTSYTDDTTFRAAVAPPLTTENFDGFESGTVITTQIPGVVVSSPNQDSEGYFPIQTFSDSGAVSPPNILFGGFIPSTSIRQVFNFAFSPRISAIAFYVTDQSPNASAVTVSLTFADDTAQSIFVSNTSGSETTPIFFGVTSDTPISNIAVISGLENDTGLFEEFGLDNLEFKSLDENPPICSRIFPLEPSTAEIDGQATDAQPGDTGIASVTLGEGSSNVALDVASFDPGAAAVTFRATQLSTTSNALGTIVVTDLAEHSCTLGVDLRSVPAGALDTQILCQSDGIVFAVTNGNTGLPGGTEACSADVLTGTEPALPAGYSPSPPDDPFPCQVVTIDSPVFGNTEMIYKKDGVFDPKLRLLYSRSPDNGATFPAFIDVTQSVESIQSISGDPTRLKGGGTWSPVKVACALQSQSCATTDNDGDGYFLCATDTAPADCNDRDASVHPGATEVCNGIDDNCNGQVDEGNPGGGLACTVPGKLGACAAGQTACQQGSIVCNQTVFPTTEVCDGIDNDCNGQTDENLVFGGYLQPVNADGTSIFRVGRTVPFKFQLTNCAGGFISNAVATIQIFFFANHVVGSEVEDVTSAGQANTDNLYRFDPTSNQYIYNLSTKNLTGGASYLVRTTIVGDPTPHDVIISTR